MADTKKKKAGNLKNTYNYYANREAAIAGALNEPAKAVKVVPEEATVSATPKKSKPKKTLAQHAAEGKKEQEARDALEAEEFRKIEERVAKRKANKKPKTLPLN